MSKRYMPELGQAVFGCPFGGWECPDYVEALLDSLLKEIERVYWNINQKKWDLYEDPKLKDIEYRPYYWGEDEKEAIKPNFKYGKIEIRWYKHVGRGMTINKNMTRYKWVEWFNECLKVIRDQDPSLLDIKKNYAKSSKKKSKKSCN